MMHKKYTKDQLSKKLLYRCQECANGGHNVFPDCLDFDPTKDCYYFDDINDYDPQKEDYDCGEYIHQDTYDELSGLIKNK